MDVPAAPPAVARTQAYGLRLRAYGLRLGELLKAHAFSRKSCKRSIKGRFGFDVMDATGLTSGTAHPALERLEDLAFVTSRREADAVARREARPARRYLLLISSETTALTAAAERYSAIQRLGQI